MAPQWSVSGGLTADVMHRFLSLLKFNIFSVICDIKYINFWRTTCLYWAM